MFCDWLILHHGPFSHFVWADKLPGAGIWRRRALLGHGYKSLIGMWFPLVQSSPLLHNHQGICLRKSVAIDADVLSHWGCSPELRSEPHPHSHIQMSPHTNCLESMKTLIQHDQQGSTAFATENYWVRPMKKYLGAPEWLARSAYLCLHWGSFKGF